jgi:non-canonical (house-cleaning) NTP pyrophosphatase
LIKIYIGSLNPVKIECVRQAFQKVFNHEDYLFTGKYVSSGVSDQPMSDRETYEGARNRVIILALIPFLQKDLF